MRATAFLLMLVLGACGHQRTSRIVQLAEQSGAGRLDGVSTSSMAVWLNGHPQVTARVEALCAPVRQKAVAAWMESTEGRLCVAAKATTAERHFFHYVPAPKDSTGFRPGWK